MTRPALPPDNPLDDLLQRLGPTPAAAGEAYEVLRRLLMRYFEVRGRSDADRLCDEVLDRLGRKLAEGVVVDSVTSYARGVARLVFLESTRQPLAAPLDDDVARSQVPMEAEAEPALECLEGCLDRMDADLSRQVLTYYDADGRGRIDGRRRQADALGISPLALRLRMLRARTALERCTRACLEGRNTYGGGSTSR